MKMINKALSLKLGLVLLFLTAGGLVTAKFYPFALRPCAQPIEYSIGLFDFTFKISQSEFLAAISQAEQIWELPINNRQLFQYVPVAIQLKINLIYDYRQEATDRLKSLGYNIETTQSSYNNLKNRYVSLTQSYNQQKPNLEVMISSFESRKKVYEQQVEYWNRQGGAPKSEVAKLNAEHDALADLANQITAAKNSLNKLVDDINAVANILNSLAKQLNLNVSSYNKIGESRGEEFEEGVYVADQTGRRIDIYEFNNQDQLIRLLAHELGHALGLDHVEDPRAIMYRLNQAQNETLTSDDLNELKKVCKIK